MLLSAPVHMEAKRQTQTERDLQRQTNRDRSRRTKTEGKKEVTSSTVEGGGGSGHFSLLNAALYTSGYGGKENSTDRDLQRQTETDLEEQRLKERKKFTCSEAEGGGESGHLSLMNAALCTSTYQSKEINRQREIYRDTQTKKD